jgi:nucleoside-diphosphate-sugar epimerase
MAWSSKIMETVLVLGANGRFGRVVVRAFAEAGWNVVAQARRPLVDGADGRVRHLGAAVTGKEAVVNMARGASIVVHAMNPLYTNWDAEALPLNAAAIGIADSLGATLMLPGNIYNYGSPVPAELTEQTPQRPTNRKGEIRCQMEAIRAGAPGSIVVRAGDFFGGPGAGSWFDQAIVKDLGRGKITYPGPLDVLHAWAYLPDLARTFVLLAQARRRLARHQCFHFPGYALRGDELAAAIARAAHRRGILADGRVAAIKRVPWTAVRIAGVVNPLLRELARMSYLWRQPHRLAGAALERVIGTIPVTPLDAALEQALAQLPFPAAGSADPAASAA